jgi:putative nucleotidyltransferase with HDIG domain
LPAHCGAAAVHLPTLLVVDDEPEMLSYVMDVLSPKGFHCIGFDDALGAIRYLASPQADPVGLVLSDIGMPGMNGLEFLRGVKTMAPDLPVVFLSGLYNLATALDATRRGASDYLLKPAMPEDILRLVRKHFRGQEDASKEAVRLALAQFMHRRQSAGASGAVELAPLFEFLGFTRFETLQHSLRVAEFSLLIACTMTFSQRERAALELGAQLHDIGKTAIPHNVLMKPGPLTPEEQHIMRMHPVIGQELLSAFQGVEPEAAHIVSYHHEAFDGGGYPAGLEGAAIPIGARIFAVADTLDAITSDRPYRKGASLSVARTEIGRMSGRQFDPAVLECFNAIEDRLLLEVQAKYPG